MHKPCGASLAIGLIPFIAMCFSVSWWDRVYPFVFGIPFNIFWIVAWIIITPFVMSVAYRIEKAAIARKQEGSKHE